MKKWIFLLFAAAFLLCVNASWTSAAVPKQAEPVPKLYLDGRELDASVPPRLVNDWVLVPIRTVAENMGYKVGWDSEKKQVTVEEGSTHILMTIGSIEAIVDGETMTMQTPPLIQSDATLIPLRFVSETFGLQILWDNKAKAVFLYTDVAEEDEANPGSTDEDAGENVGSADGEAGENAGPIGADAGEDAGSADEEIDGDADTDEIANSDVADSETAPEPGMNPGSEAGDEQNEPGKEEDKELPGEPIVQLPASPPAKLSQIRYEPNALILTYTGELTPAVHTLVNPDRLAVDLIHAEFADEFSSGFSSGILPDYFPKVNEAPASGQIAEMKVSGDPLVTGIRFSKFSDSPRTVRVVMDLSQFAQYELIHDTERGEVRLLLQNEFTFAPIKDGYIVVLDAGHGGSDPGAKSITGRWEKEFNLSVVKKVKEILSKESKINLVLTREGDTYPTLDDRFNLANSLNADLFVSVHGNSYKPEINGTETYYYRPDSRPFADLLHKNVLAATGFKDNGVRTAEFKVIKYTEMPAVLLEVGYLSNADNEKEMFEEEFQQRVAEAIAASIKQYFNLS